ncbi:adipocyte plasma membrane-associated protein Hemomucin-like [Hylaeus anthracinus]|uniref:adipocyte plasma membrane-associated protein Hemomucin-like n=1 Tax=Hylaeus anthracinus TaxID=313031 RepID=UPI0023B89127|nr:adipocyte plasma membrane-associated protein Hemomucin-like [Hylaeus anthracinus]
MGYLKSIGTVIIYFGLVLTVITFLPGLPPDAEFSEYSIKLPADPENRFKIKNRLQGAEELFSGEIKGPECFASYNGELYTGISGGYVVKIEENRIVPIVKFGQKCDGLWQEAKCGKPLGLKFNSKGELFVMDAYYGIFKVNVKTRQYTNIVNSSEPIDEQIPRLGNSLDIAKNGDIYWTDSSTNFPLHDGAYSFLANPSGRLIRYNAVTKKNEVLVKNLGFANGVALSDDESFLIVLECLASRIIKYHLKGPKAGQQEIFAESLPGVPDNVHSDEQGGFLVTLYLYIDSQHPFLSHSLIPHPYLRKMIVRLFYLIEAPFKLLEEIYPNYYAERVLHSVGSFESMSVLDTAQTSVVLRIDKNGNVFDAIYSEDKKIHTMSSAYIYNGYLWLGSPINDYIMRVPLKQAFPEWKESETVKRQTKDEPLPTKMPNIKVEVKPTNVQPPAKETTQKPATTTPKPTTKVPTQKPATVATTQKPVADATIPKSTTQKPVANATPKPTTQKPVANATPKPTTQKPVADATTPKPTTKMPTVDATIPKLNTQKPVADATIPKSNTQKPVADATIPKSNIQKPVADATVPKSTTQTSTTAPKPAVQPPNVKTPMKETTKDNVEEVKKVNSNSNVNTKTSNVKIESGKANEAPIKSKSDEPIKQTQPEKSKPVGKTSDSNTKK